VLSLERVQRGSARYAGKRIPMPTPRLRGWRAGSALRGADAGKNVIA